MNMDHSHELHGRVVNSMTQNVRGSGSQTVTIEATPVLKLRAKGQVQRPSVKWGTEVIDNENMDKKKSKVCCIFHPQDPDLCIDEDPDHEHDHIHVEESSDSETSESDSERSLDLEERRRRRLERRRRKLAKPRSESPNAYEVQPDYTNKKV